MGVQLELRSMVDTALGCPEKGIVNFNVLHSLLHQILDHLGNGKTLEKDVESGYGGFSGEEVNKGNVQETTNCEQTGEAGGGKVDEHSRSSSSYTRRNSIEERLGVLESKFEALNNLPTNKTTISNVEQKDGGENESSSDNNLATMWKFMTVSRRVQAAEEAVEKVMGILNEVLQDISHLKNTRTDLERLREDHLKMEQEFDTVKSGALQTNLENASEYVKQFESLDTFAFKKDLTQFVTWSALERALTKKEVQGGCIGDTTDETTRDEDSIERPGTAPVPSNTIWEKVDEPPRTAMSPREFQKLADQSPNLGVNLVNDENSAPKEDSVNGILSIEENSLGEISLNTKDQPSHELITQLNRLGQLPKQCDDVAVQVSTISELHSKLASEVRKVEVDILPQKVDKDEFHLPDNLLEQIEMLKQGLGFLNANQDLEVLSTIKTSVMENKEHIHNMKREMGLFSQHLKRIDCSRPKSPESGVPGYDEEVLKSVRSHLTSIQKEQEKMALKNKDDLDKVLESLDEKQRYIDDLIQYTEQLQERKADRENVATEMDVKADKHALDGKVSQSTFDATFEMFDRGLQEALQKMEDYLNEEIALKDTLSRISHEMEGKIDSDSLQLMKDYFEKQIKDVQESRDKIARETRVDATDAAGVRRKLPIHYHCISCSRPVEVAIKDSEPALPGVESLPLRRLRFPFTSYEIEQLRQRSIKAGYNVDDNSTLRDLISGRPCGGSHTVINSQVRRSTKMHQFSQITAARDDPRHCPKITREVSVIDFLQGSDGHYYKGRTKQVLPSIPKRTIPPSSDTRTVDQSSIKGKQVSPTDTATSLSADHRQLEFNYRRRTPSPPPRERYTRDLSSSYPENSFSSNKFAKRSFVQHHSSDDINLPSTTSLHNSESIKILQNRRKRAQDKDAPRQRCWDSRQLSEKGDIQQNQSREFDDKSGSPKSIKRTTPVGREESCSVSRESTRHEHVEQKVATEDDARISDDRERN